jgi:hypothetical protein
MTEATRQAGSPAIDQSRKYKVNGGQCERCGYFKTWEFRVPNNKSGKLMPGHVTEDGFKVGNGNCPFWGSMVINNADRAQQKPAAPGPRLFDKQALASAGSGARAQAAINPAGNGVSSTATNVNAIPMASLEPGISSFAAEIEANGGVSMQHDGNKLVVSIGQVTLTIDKQQAIWLAKDLLDFLVQ